MFGYLRIFIQVWILPVRVLILPVLVQISNLSEFNNRSGILLLQFGFSDRIHIQVRVSDKMTIPNKSYEYQVSLIDIHIIYIYIYIYHLK